VGGVVAPVPEMTILPTARKTTTKMTTMTTTIMTNR
jgi:hypothetical protein